MKKRFKDLKVGDKVLRYKDTRGNVEILDYTVVAILGLTSSTVQIEYDSGSVLTHFLEGTDKWLTDGWIRINRQEGLDIIWESVLDSDADADLTGFWVTLTQSLLDYEEAL